MNHRTAWPILLALLAGCAQPSGEGGDEIVGESESSESESSESESSESSSESESSESESSESESSESSDTESSDTESSDTTETGIAFECERKDPLIVPDGCGPGVEFGPEFAPHYECLNLGDSSVPPLWGAFTIALDDPYTLLMGGNGASSGGAIFGVELLRDEDCHVMGWATGAQEVELFAEADYIDVGLAYGPDDVLFYSRRPDNYLAQQKLGSPSYDKLIDLGPLGVANSVGPLAFGPPGFVSEGELKMASWPGGQWYTIALAPDGMGTFDVVSATHELTIPGSPDGFAYVRAGNPGFPVDGLLIAENSNHQIVAYDVDANGDPFIGTRRVFVSGLNYPTGGLLDPYSGDFLFSIFDSGTKLIVIHGFTPN